MSSLKFTDFLVVGRITKARGLDGTVSVFPLTDNPQRFRELKQGYLLDNVIQQQQPVDYERYRRLIDKVSVSGTKVHLRFIDIIDREGAESLQGEHIYVPRTEAVKLPEDSWFVCDLVDCQVLDQNLGNIGVVKDVLTNGPQSTLVIAQTGASDLLLPLRKVFVPTVDVVNKMITTCLPDGLYEIYRK